MCAIPVELPQVPERPVEGHKGTFGRVMIIAGSRGMSGAAALAGMAALRGGAGLVYLAVPEGILPIVASIEPSYLTIPLREDEAGRICSAALETIEQAAREKTAIAIGPGLGLSKGLRSLVRQVYQHWDQPLVVDADALNALAEQPEDLSVHTGPRILTPHPGEFARLTGLSIEEILAQRQEVAQSFAKAHQIVLVLKGAGTIVTDGNDLFVNPTGNSGLGTGGTGDVLTGLMTALCGQGMSPFDAARLAVWMHGRAGDIGAERLSQPGLIAHDLPGLICDVWRELAAP